MVFLKRFALFFVILSHAFAAVSGSTVWEIRTTGAATNGGGFVTGASGTDFSQQDAAQCTATDLTLPSTTTATSATCPFSATSPGNIIQITAGANCTAGFYQIVSQAAGVATLDRVAGTVGCTAGTFSIGGALSLPNLPCTTMVNGNTVWLKSGTYTVTATCLLSNTNNTNETYFIPYTTTRGDGGRITWTTATNSTKLVNMSGMNNVSFTRIDFTSTASTKAEGIGNNTTSSFAIVIDNCTFTNLLNGIHIRSGDGNIINNVTVSGSTASGIRLGSTNTSTGGSMYNVWTHNNASHGIELAGAGTNNITLVNVTSSANTGDGINGIQASGNINDQSMLFVNLNLANNTGDGFEYQSGSQKTQLFLYNSIIYGNGGIGIKFASAPTYAGGASNAFGSNTGGNTQNWTATPGDVTLTANPWTSSTNFALNSTAGGGAALKGVGFPGVSTFGTGYVDIGPLQHQEATPVSGGGKFGYAN